MKKKKWFAIYREIYGITVKFLGEFDAYPNHLDQGYIEIIDECELFAFKGSVENCLAIAEKQSKI